MSNVFRCPSCGRELEAPHGAHGLAGACMFCGAKIKAPSAPSAPAGLVPPLYTFGAAPVAAEPLPYSQPAGSLDAARVITELWPFLKRYWASLLVAQFMSDVLLFGAVMLMVVGAALLMPEAARQAESAPQASGSPAPFIAVVVLTELLAYPITFGPLYHAHSVVARGDASIGSVFGWVRNYGALVAFFPLLALPIAPFGLLMYAVQLYAPHQEYLMIPIAIMGLAVFGFLLVSLGLGVMEIIDRGSGAISALRASWEFTRGHRWAIFGAVMLLHAVSMCGMFACYFGFLFTMNAIPLGIVIIYRQLRGLQGAQDG